MTAYVNNPFQPAKFVMPGVACYLWGSHNDYASNTQMRVTNVALTSNVATLTVQVFDGNVPVAGSLVSVQQTQTASGAFNVNRVALTSTTIDATTGAGTIVFPLTHANVGSAADTGLAVIEVPETPEALVAGASIAACVQIPDGDSQYTLPV